MSSRANSRKIVVVLGGGPYDGSAGEELCTLRLTHPRGGESLFVHRGRRLFEVQRRRPASCGSWLVGEDVARDGSLLVASSFDARFFVLSLLTKSTAYVQLGDLVSEAARREDDGNDDLLVLLDLEMGSLAEVFDVNEKHPDLQLLRIDEKKIVDWLEAKVRRVATALKPSVTSSAFTSSAAPAAAASSSSEPGHREVLRAAQAVADYVADEWASKLASRLGLDLADFFAGVKRPLRATDPVPAEDKSKAWSYDSDQQKLRELAFGVGEQASKKSRLQPPAKKPETAHTKAMAKAAKNTKSIGSFFGAKPKPKT